MSHSRILFAGTVAAALVLAGCAAAPDDEKKADPPASEEQQQAAPEPDLKGLPDVVAVVNGEDISLDEFTTVYTGQLQQTAAQQQQSGGGEVDQDQLKTQVADMLVNNVLLTQAATDSGVEATDDEVDAMLKQVAQQSGLSSVDEVIAEFDKQGMSEKDVRSDAANQVMIDEYVDAETDIEPPSDKELKAQYDKVAEQAKAQGGTESLPKFDEVKEQLSQQAVAQEENAQVQKILDGLRKKGDVDIRL